MRIPFLPFFLAATLALAIPAFAELPVAELQREEPVNFATEVYPFLKANCLACHNSTKAKADLILESPQDMIRGGDSGPALAPGDAEKSFLFTTAAHLEEPTMPPANNKSKAENLTPMELALLKRWIEEGAKGDTVSTQAPDSWTYLSGPQPIYTAALSADGRFAVASRGQNIDLYDLRLGRLEASLRDPALEHPTAHRDLVQAVAFSPDGTIASGGYRTVKIWKRDPAAEGKSIPLPNEPTAMAVSSDRKQTAIGSKDGSILLLSNENPDAAPVTIKDHGGEVTDLEFSPDGTALFSSSVDKTIRRRSTSDPGSAISLTLPAPVQAIALLQGGKVLVAGGADQTLRFLNADLKTPLKAAVPAPAPAPAPQKTPQPSPTPAEGEAKTPAEAKPAAPAPAAPNSAAAAQPAATKPEPPKAVPAVIWSEFKLHGQPIVSIESMSSVPTNFLVGYGDGTIVQGKVNPDQLLAAPTEVRRIAHGAPLANLVVSPLAESPLLASGGKTGPAKIWNLSDGKLLHEVQGDPGLPPRIEALVQETAVANRLKAYWDGKAPEEEKLWKAESEKAKQSGEAISKARRDLVAKKQALSALEAQTPTAKEEDIAKAKEAVLAAERALSGVIRNRESAARLAGDAFARHTAAQSASLEAAALAGALQAEAEALRKQSGESIAKTERTALAFSPDGAVLTEALPNGILRQWSTRSGAWLEDIPTPSGPTLIAATATHGMVIATGDKKATLWSLPGHSWTLAKTLGNGKDPEPFVDRVSALAFDPDGDRLLVGTGVPSRIGEISLWNTETWETVATNDEAHDDTITSFAFSPDGSRFASGGTDQLVKIFETATLTPVKTFEGHTSHVLDVDWNADDLTLASAGADLQVKVWDLNQGQEKSKVEGFQKEVSSVVFVGSTDILLTASGDMSLKLSNQPLPGAGVTFLHTADVSPDGKTIIAGGQDSVLRVWEAGSKQLLQSFPSPQTKEDGLAAE